MKKLRVLIVDDSVIYRSQVRSAFDGLKFIEVVASVSNGVYALSKLSQEPVDLVILDLEMPEMDGLETLSHILKDHPGVAVVMFAAQTQRSAEATIEALSLGAKDFVTKPGPDTLKKDSANVPPSTKVREVLKPIILGLFPEFADIPEEPKEVLDDNRQYPHLNWDLFDPKVLVIGSSTGGPTALEKLFTMLRPPFRVPILITQHMPPVFTTSFAQRLGRIAGIPTYEASDGLYLQPNHIYLAPGDYHMSLTGSGMRVKIQLDQNERINSIRPSIDPLFETASQIYGKNCLGVILTGMGADGSEGTKRIKDRGGAVLIQNKESCVVWGMPAMVYRNGSYDRMGDLHQLQAWIQKKVGGEAKYAKAS